MKSYAAIRALSTYLPKEIEKNDMDKSHLDKLGIYKKHIASESEAASDLAVNAANNLFKEYDIDKNSIDYIVLCAQHPDYPMPPTSCIIQDKLNLSQSTAALDISMGCSGYLYSLSVVKGLIEAELSQNTLLLTSAISTKYINKKDHVMRPLFGDGATATLVSAVEADNPLIHSFVFGTDGSRFDKLYIPAGGSKNPPNITKEILEDDEGAIHSNYEWRMDGSAISFFTLRTVPTLVENVLNKANLKREDIDYYIFHQANKFMMAHVQKKCKLDNMPFYNDISEIGNTVAGSVPFGIDYVLKENSFKNLSNVMLAGFGVGLSWSACVANLTEMINKK